MGTVQTVSTEQASPTLLLSIGAGFFSPYSLAPEQQGGLHCLFCIPMLVCLRGSRLGPSTAVLNFEALALNLLLNSRLEPSTELYTLSSSPLVTFY